MFRSVINLFSLLARLTVYQKDDPGLLTIAGFSAGACSKLMFGWARNIERRCREKEMISELARDTAAAFALFWNLCQSWLPPVIVSDINKFVAMHSLPAMDPAAATSVYRSGYDDRKITVTGPNRYQL